MAYYILFIIFMIPLVLMRKLTNPKCKSPKRLDGKTVVVTGGTSGIGLEVATNLALRGARVIVACPFEEEGTKAERHIIEISGNKNVVFKILDLSSLLSTREFAEDVLKTEDRLDLLINNAGVCTPKVTTDGLSQIMQVNYYGHFLLTMLLLPLLVKTGKEGDPARIVMTSSIAHWLGNNNVRRYERPWCRYESYCDSKLALHMFCKELSKKLSTAHAVVNTVDPGIVGTSMFESAFIAGFVLRLFFYYFSKTPLEGSQTILHVALDTNAGTVSGKHYSDCKIAFSRHVYEDISRILFDHSAKCVRLSVEKLQHSLCDSGL